MRLNRTKHIAVMLVRLGLLLIVGAGTARLGIATAYQFKAPATPNALSAKSVEASRFTETWPFDSAAAVQGGTMDGLVWLDGQGFVATGDGSVPGGAGSYLSPPLTAQGPVQALVAEWVPGANDVEPVGLALRWQAADGTWSDWVDFHEDHEMPPPDGQISTPVLVPDATTFQWRMVVPPRQSVGRVLLGSVAVEPGPDVGDVGVLGVPLPNGGPVVIGRAEWGAPATVPWEPEPSRPRAIVVHHTATSTGGNNPAAVVRAIDVYHRVTRDWGDIGYHYLIDHQGRIYAGRVGGPETIGAHAYDFNNGTVGIALIGTFETSSISPAARNSLVALTTWLSKTYRINPEGSTTFYDRPYATIMGHRHTGRKTTCPGERIVAELPQFRRLVAQRLAGIVPPYPPGIELAGNGEWARGSVTATLNPQDAAPTQYALLLDGREIGTGNASFQATIDTTTLTDGEHSLVAVARQGTLASENEMVLRVDNRPPTTTLANTPTAEAATMTLADATSGIAQARLRRRNASGAWSEWATVEGTFPAASFNSTARFEGAAALQWQATDRAGNSVESAVVEGPALVPLAIESVELFPAQPMADEPFAVQVMVANRSTRTTSEPATVTVEFQDGRTLRWRINPGLPAGATVLLRNSDRNVLADSTFKGTLPAGTYQMEAVVEGPGGQTRWGPRPLTIQSASTWRLWFDRILRSHTATTP